MAASAFSHFRPRPPGVAALLAALGLFVAAMLLIADDAAPPAPAAADGVVDLRHWNVADEALRPLGTGWSFYWDALLPPADFAGPDLPAGAVAAEMPAAWHVRFGDDIGRTGRGVATYHLRLRLPEGGPPLAIRLPVTYSASILWANGQPLIVNGQPARGFAAERRVAQDRIAMLPPAGTVDLVLQVSNHMVPSGGPTREPAIGTPDALYQQFGRQVARDLFVVGACIVVGLFFLVLFATRPRERGFAWFAAFCLVISLVYAHFADVPMLFAPTLIAPVPNIYLVMVMMAAPAGSALFLFVLSALYPGEVSRRAALIAGALLLGYPVALAVSRIVSPDMLSPQWEALRIATHAVILASIAYGLAGVATAAIRRRRGAIVATAAVMIFTAAVWHDLASLRAGGGATPLIGAGFLVVVFAYAAILGGRLNAAITDAEALSDDLRLLNQTLERKVADRTAELERAARLAEAADRTKTQFMTAANHDLRQPLHAMALIADALDARLREPAQRDLVAALRACLAGTRRLLAGMLDLARLDAGAVRPERAACDLAPLLAETTAELQPLAAERGVRLRLVDTRHAVVADPALLGRILANLIGNAIKYAPGGRVVVGCRRSGDRLRLEVHDNGIGIAEADRERIFADFHQGAPAPGQAREGLGLGLSITRRFARLMGSDIAVRSLPGRGSCFSLDLPAAPRVVPAAGDDLAGLRVMVVATDAPAIADMLAGWGCIATDERPEVLLAENEAEIAAIGRRLGYHPPAALIGGDGASGAGLPVLRRPFQPGNLASLLRHLARRARAVAA